MISINDETAGNTKLVVSPEATSSTIVGGIRFGTIVGEVDREEVLVTTHGRVKPTARCTEAACER
jgi:hypothetical protein